MALQNKNCVLTGANGFVGSNLAGYLQGRGWNIIPWVRRPTPGSGEVGFILGQAVDPGCLHNVQAVIHAAYDFGPRRWDEITAVNVAGSNEVLRAAKAAGVESIVLISSLSAFPGCRSLYGKAKMQAEDTAASVGAYVIRPGLIYGDAPGGVFGRLVKQVRGSHFVPVLAGGRQTQYLLHSNDLGELVAACLTGGPPATSEPVSAAHEQAWELRELLARIAQALGQPVRFVPVPWMAVWLGLRALEAVGVKTNFRSDSLIGMVCQNPRPSFDSLRNFGLRCRPFTLTPESLRRSESR
jgi:nucleoside-diphosphate-sugar epimerase